MTDKKKVLYFSENHEQFLQLENALHRDSSEYMLITATDKRALMELFSQCSLTCIVMDDTLRDRNPRKMLIHWLKKNCRNIPVIVVLTSSVAARRLEVYEDGADAYICEPFLPDELLYLIRLVCRQTGRAKDMVVLANAMVNLHTATVTKNGDTRRLTGTEFRIFTILLENANGIVSVRTLCEAICGKNWEGYERTLLTHIYHIREKIECKPSEPISLVTVKGLGYQLNIVGLQ